MPAIKIKESCVSTPSVVSHVELKGNTVVESNFGHACIVGFICTQGMRYIEKAKLAKIFPIAITNDDGNEESVWRAVSPKDAVYTVIIMGNGNPREEAYVIVDDEGWPMLAGVTPPEYFPSEVNYVAPVFNFHSGR